MLRETIAVGVDSIAFRFIKESLPASTFMINTSIVTGNNPSICKKWHMTSILKSGDVEKMNNCRPITLPQ